MTVPRTIGPCINENLSNVTTRGEDIASLIGNFGDYYTKF